MGTTLASNNELSKALDLPKHVVPVVGFSLGYPDEEPEQRERLPMDAIIHYEKYQDYSNEKINEIYKEKENKGMKRYNDNQELREMIKKSGVKNLAQVYTKVKYTRESHIKYSKDVMECLQNQGFINKE